VFTLSRTSGEVPVRWLWAAFTFRIVRGDLRGARDVAFVRDHKLHGRGIRWIDVHLLAAALVARLDLWTTDPALATVAKELRISYE
jgi:hypothetical protein